MIAFPRSGRALLVHLALTTVFAAGATAAPPTLSSGPGGEVDARDAFDCLGNIEWEQLPDGASLLSSQIDACYPFTSEVADDFLGRGRWAIGIGWWGTYWGGTPLRPDAFQITYYLDDGGVPGEQIGSERILEYNETPGDPFGYCANYYTDEIPILDGCVYHVSVAAEFCFPPQWGMATGEGNGVEAHFRSEFFGFPDWVDATAVFGFPYELAFLNYHVEFVEPDPHGHHWCCLPDGTCVELDLCESCPGERVPDCTSCGSTPVDRSSWGRVKSQYR